MLLGEPLMRHTGGSVPLMICVQALTIVASFGAAYIFSPVNDLAVAMSRRAGRYAATFLPLLHQGLRPRSDDAVDL
jgi:hypothetical protein